MTAPSSPSRWPGAVPATGLFLLSPWVGEYLLGNVPGQHILLIPFLALMYGGGAVLIREVTRRSGRGWPTMLSLAAAYGVVEAGLVDQSLFNPSFTDLGFDTTTRIPVLDVVATNAIAFIGGHVVWSICVPIALVEMLTPRRRTTPWLGSAGLTVTVLLYLLGCWILFSDISESEDFIASPAKLSGAAAAAVVLVVVAFLFRGPQAPRTTSWVPRPWVLGVGAFVYSSVFFARPENWYGVAMALVLVPVAAMLIRHWSRSTGWTGRHHLALVGGTLLTYAWGGFVLTSLFYEGNPVNYLFNGIFAVVAVLLVVWAARRVPPAEPLPPIGAGAGLDHRQGV